MDERKPEARSGNKDVFTSSFLPPPLKSIAGAGSASCSQPAKSLFLFTRLTAFGVPGQWVMGPGSESRFWLVTRDPGPATFCPFTHSPMRSSNVVNCFAHFT